MLNFTINILDKMEGDRQAKKVKMGVGGAQK